MISLTDPTLLSPADAYRQAKLLYSRNDRSSGDPNWYQSADNLDLQWHLWFEGGRDVLSAALSLKDHTWRAGPALPLATLTTSENVEQLLAAALSPAVFGCKPKAMGVILHIADEFALSKLDENTAPAASSEDLQILRYNLIDQPLEVLEDKKVSDELTSWRLLPFPGAKPSHSRCTAVTISRNRESFLQKLIAAGENASIPVRVSITSAPIEALAAIPTVYSPTSQGSLVVMPYLKFTAVFLLNAAGDLVTARSLSHRSDIPIPVGLGEILWNMSVRAEMVGIDESPSVFVVGSNAQIIKAIKNELDPASPHGRTFRVDSIDLSDHKDLASIPGRRLEFLIYDSASAKQMAASGSFFSKSATFGHLWSWAAKQSYFNTAKIDALYPSLGDFRLMKLARWGIGMMLAVILSLAGYGGYLLFTAMNHPSWKLTPEQVKKAEETNAKLIVESRQIEQTTHLLKPRSHGWANLEFLYQLFPEDSGVRLERFSYQLDSDKSARPSGKGPTPTHLGMLRTWTLKGLIQSKGLALLSDLNSQRGLTTFFEKVAKNTGDTSFLPDSTRLLTVTLTQSRNSRFDPQASSSDVVRDPTVAFPFSFEATITQTISEKDPLALPVDKPF